MKRLAVLRGWGCAHSPLPAPPGAQPSKESVEDRKDAANREGLRFCIHNSSLVGLSCWSQLTSEQQARERLPWSPAYWEGKDPVPFPWPLLRGLASTEHRHCHRGTTADSPNQGLLCNKQNLRWLFPFKRVHSSAGRLPPGFSPTPTWKPGRKKCLVGRIIGLVNFPKTGPEALGPK